VRVTVRVYPAAKRASVGGRYGSSEPPVLMVRVAAPAVDGKANEAVLESVSAAFGVPRRNARIVSGSGSRTKVVELECADPRFLAALLATPAK
jgi:uncharacterized protein